MSKLYKETMDKIKMTDDMRMRILKNIETLDLKAVKDAEEPKEKASQEITPKNIVRFKKYKKYLSVAACFVILIAGIAGAKTDMDRYEQDNIDNPPTLTMTAPDDYSTSEELAEAAGFDMPDIVNLSGVLDIESESESYVFYSDDGMAEMNFSCDLGSACIRKAKGSEDISGLYIDFSNVDAENINGTSVELCGNDGSYTLARWQKDGCFVSVYFDSGTDKETFKKILKKII